jgi:leucyl aminopeptidase
MPEHISCREKLMAALAREAGRQSGERVCVFPMDEDCEIAVENKVADIKQCTLEGEADHILAARFLMRFVEDVAWLHMDLSASNCEGGLGAVAGTVTGFGVGWGMAMLRGLQE